MPPPTEQKIAAIVLAAGASTRMGWPKQLLVYRGQTLVRRSAEQAIAAGCSPVIVVLGAAPEAATELHDLPVIVAHNPQWSQGMGASIRAGVAALPGGPAVDAVLLMLCDQPLIDAAALRQLIDARATTPCLILAAAYNGTLGVPALFDASFLPTLATLSPDAGAKSLLLNRREQVLAIPLPQAGIDVDTPGEYERL